MAKTKRVLVFNDPHIPFHCKTSVDLMLDVASDVEVDEIVINGDLLDMYQASSYGPKNPFILETLETEIIAGREFLEKLRERFPEVKIHFLYGNHEARMEKMILEKLKAFFNMVKLESQLNLKALDITFQYYNEFYQLTPGLRVQHSPPSYGVNGARTSLLTKLDMSYIWGCTHRVQYATLSGASGKVYEAWFNGCLIDFDSKVFEYTKGHSNWQKCFMIVDVINDLYFGHQCIIKGNTTSLDGHIYIGG